MRYVTPIALIAVMALSACGGKSPTEPEPTPNLSLSTTSVALARGETTQISAMALVAGGNRVDVSQEATWTSSNPAVVTAAAGALTATGPGTAEIQVTYRGITQRVTVTARRNTTIGGLLIMRQAETDFIRLNNTSLLIDGRNVGGGGSDHGGYRRLSMLFGWAPNIEKSRHSMFDLPPGDYEMTVRVVEPWALTSTQPFTIYNDTDESWAVLSDRDTDEILGSVVFPRRQVTLTGPGEMTLPFSVPAFTN